MVNQFRPRDYITLATLVNETFLTSILYETAEKYVIKVSVDGKDLTNNYFEVSFRGGFHTVTFSNLGDLIGKDFLAYKEYSKLNLHEKKSISSTQGAERNLDSLIKRIQAFKAFYGYISDTVSEDQLLGDYENLLFYADEDAPISLPVVNTEEPARPITPRTNPIRGPRPVVTNPNEPVTPELPETVTVPVDTTPVAPVTPPVTPPPGTPPVIVTPPPPAPTPEPPAPIVNRFRSLRSQAYIKTGVLRNLSNQKISSTLTTDAEELKAIAEHNYLRSSSGEIEEIRHSTDFSEFIAGIPSFRRAVERYTRIRTSGYPAYLNPTYDQRINAWNGRGRSDYLLFYFPGTTRPRKSSICFSELGGFTTRGRAATDFDREIYYPGAGSPGLSDLTPADGRPAIMGDRVSRSYAPYTSTEIQTRAIYWRVGYVIDRTSAINVANAKYLNREIEDIEEWVQPTFQSTSGLSGTSRQYWYGTIPKDPFKNGMLALKELVSPINGYFYPFGHYDILVTIRIRLDGSSFTRKLRLSNVKTTSIGSSGVPSGVQEIEDDISFTYISEFNRKPRNINVEYEFEIVKRYSVAHTFPSGGKYRYFGINYERATATSRANRGKLIGYNMDFYPDTPIQLQAYTGRECRLVRSPTISSPFGSSSLTFLRCTNVRRTRPIWDDFNDTEYPTEPTTDTFVTQRLS